MRCSEVEVLMGGGVVGVGRVTKVGRRSAFKLRKFKGALGWIGKLRSLTASKIIIELSTFPSTLLSMVFRQQ